MIVTVYQSLSRTQTHSDFIKTIRWYKEDKIQCHVQLWKFHIAFPFRSYMWIPSFQNAKLLSYNIKITSKKKEKKPSQNQVS